MEAAHPNRFRMRGEQVTRIETLTDAAFAFALTLLVIAFEPITTFTQLSTALQAIPSFVLSALILLVFWWGHHEWSRRYGLDDFVTFVLSCLLVCTVMIYVYPLRFMSQVFVVWFCQVSRIKVTTDIVVESPSDINGVFAVYGIGFAVMSGCLVLLNVHAWRRREALGLTPFERRETREVTAVWLFLVIGGALSTVVALLTPPTWFGIPGWCYMIIPALMPFRSRLFPAEK